MSDLALYLCPHDLDKRRERCLMCHPAIPHGAVIVTKEELAKALRDVEREWTNGAYGTPLYRDEPGIIAAAILAAIREQDDGT